MSEWLIGAIFGCALAVFVFWLRAQVVDLDNLTTADKQAMFDAWKSKHQLGDDIGV